MRSVICTCRGDTVLGSSQTCSCCGLPPTPSRPPRDQQGNLVLQPGDCCLLILQCLCVHQMVGRWICVCVSVCVRAPHKRLSARAFALTARKKRRLTSEPQSRRGERLPRDSRQEDDCDCTRHGHGRPKATRRPSRSARLPGIRTLGQGLDR